MCEYSAILFNLDFGIPTEFDVSPVEIVSSFDRVPSKKTSLLDVSGFLLLVLCARIDACGSSNLNILAVTVCGKNKGKCVSFPNQSMHTLKYLTQPRCSSALFQR